MAAGLVGNKARMLAVSPAVVDGECGAASILALGDSKLADDCGGDKSRRLPKSYQEDHF